MLALSKYQEILEDLKPYNARLVAVSKTKPLSDIRGLYEQGQRIFGENRVEELREKQPQLPDDIEWHMIGHLQRKKVKYIAPFISLIHSGDSPRLLREIDKRAANEGHTIDVLLQFKIAEEESKYGLDLPEAEAFLQSEEYEELNHIRLCGVMGMATFTDDQEQIRREFLRLREIFDHLKSTYFSESPAFREISMGMSGDYPIALEEGSSMVRIGSLIFGERK